MRKLVMGMLLAAGAVLPTLAAEAQDHPPEAGQQREHGGEHRRDGGGRPDQPRPAPQAAPVQQPRPQAPAAAPQPQAQQQARFQGRGDCGAVLFDRTPTGLMPRVPSMHPDHPCLPHIEKAFSSLCERFDVVD
ncbi:hypothetical protein [Sphingomonas bacterium]|uniref:hypothetical protein n=1 Tax=Sphingomonas bacterium TaxID=1895847 RepID=UPI0015775C95|nr:hypothetical protein [Sphingomonas bacterium]